MAATNPTSNALDRELSMASSPGREDENFGGLRIAAMPDDHDVNGDDDEDDDEDDDDDYEDADDYDEDYEDAEEDEDMDEEADIDEDDEEDNPNEDDENDFDDPGNEHEVGGVRFRVVREDEDLELDDEGEPRRHIITLDGIPFRLEILGPATNRPRRRRNSDVVVDVPSLIGRELMRSGDFGSDDTVRHYLKANEQKDDHSPSEPASPSTKATKTLASPRLRQKPLHLRLLERELGLYSGNRAKIGQQLIAQTLVPRTNAEFIMHFDSRCYSGQFSRDGNFFFACTQADYLVHMYDTSNPFKWKHYKTAHYPNGRWTITDATLSPDNSTLAYSSITPVVYAVDTTPGSDRMITMDFTADRRHNRYAMDLRYAIWSIRFSGDGKEIIAGSNDSNLYTYDIETRKVTLKLSGHRDEVNAVCFGDQSSPHILYSGSDDSTIKVWDRRSMASGHEAGVFVGHTEGITYVDSKGDGRYVLSNGKDQSMKLWDIRKMMSPHDFQNLPRKSYSTGFDYRSDEYYGERTSHPNDCSLVTYRGHKVLKTLIRCHFSPPVSSGSRYVYTGSSDGKVHIYNMDGMPASVIDVRAATLKSRPKYDSDVPRGWYGRIGVPPWKTTIRDASWHPNADLIASVGWNGYGAEHGSVTLHSSELSSADSDDGAEYKPPRLDSHAKLCPAYYDD